MIQLVLFKVLESRRLPSEELVGSVEAQLGETSEERIREIETKLIEYAKTVRPATAKQPSEKEPGERSAAPSGNSGEPAIEGGESPSPGTPTSADDMTSRLEKLARLHFEGALTDSEFAAAKKQLLGTDG